MLTIIKMNSSIIKIYIGIVKVNIGEKVDFFGKRKRNSSE